MVILYHYKDHNYQQTIALEIPYQYFEVLCLELNDLCNYPLSNIGYYLEYGFRQSVKYFHPHLFPFHILYQLRSYHVLLLFFVRIQIVLKLFYCNNPSLLGSSNFHLLYLKEKLDDHDLLLS